MRFFTPINSSHYSMHKSIQIKLMKTDYFTRYFIFCGKILKIPSLITRKILNENIFVYSALETLEVSYIYNEK